VALQLLAQQTLVAVVAALMRLMRRLAVQAS
jgi:hypothetical protein